MRGRRRRARVCDNAVTIATRTPRYLAGDGKSTALASQKIRLGEMQRYRRAPADSAGCA
jgi:hypothetical protein